MKRWSRDILFVLLCLMFIANAAWSTENPSESGSISQAKAAIILCEGTIDYGLFKSIQRRANLAINLDVDYLIFEINTLGGAVISAYDISEYFLHNINDQAHTVAYIPIKAVSAGALISVACEDIVMKENARIGDCAPISMGVQLEGIEREKIESDIRSVFRTSAQANNYPSALLEAMVSKELEVYSIRNIKSDEDEYFLGTEIPADSNTYDLGTKKMIDSKDHILSLIANEAFEYGITREIVSDRQGMLHFFAVRDNVEFTSEPLILKTTWSEEISRWLNSSAVMAILILIALLGVYIEFNTPGLGLPGLVAVICFAIIIGSKYITGLANWIELVLFFAGIILILIEFFVIPGFGIAGILGFIFLFAGLFGMLLRNPPNEVPWPNNSFEMIEFNDGLIAFSLGFGGFLICAWLLSKYLPKIPYLGSMILVPGQAQQGDANLHISMTKPAESQIRKLNIGDVGEVISTLRPTGKAKFGDAIVDVVAEGDFINKGIKVEITGIHGNRVVVKAIINDI